MAVAASALQEKEYQTVREGRGATGPGPPRRRASRTRSSSGPLALLALAALVPAGCLPELPTLPEAKGASDPRVRFSTPVVWVSEPEDNGTMKRADLYSSLGAPVQFDGLFTPGTELHLLAARVQTPDLGFHILRIPVTDTVSPGPAYVQGSPAILFNTYQIRLKLRLRDADGSVVSIDSVDVNLR